MASASRPIDGRSPCPHAQRILYSAADDYGKWSKGRYCTNWRTGPVDPGDPLVVFQATVRSQAFEEAAKVAEALLGRFEDDTEQDAQIHRIAKLIRAAKSAETLTSP